VPSFLERLGARWEERAGSRFPARRGPVRRTLVGGAAGPATSVTVERVLEVAVEPREMWALVSSPRLLTVHAVPGHAFVLPGGGAERWCWVGPKVAGAMFGGLTEILEREEGRRIVMRKCSMRPFPVWEWQVQGAEGGPGSGSLVRVAVTLEVGERLVDAAERALATGLEGEMAWLLHRVTGAPRPPSPPAADADAQAAERHQERPLEMRDVEASVVVPLPADQVWAGVLDATTFSLDAAEGEWAGVVPGTPAGRVGELRCLVSAVGTLPAVRFHEVVEIGPGRRLALRQHSASHPWHLVTTVEPHPDGSLVRAVGHVALHPDDGYAQLDAIRDAVAAHLSRFRVEVVRRAAGGPGC
jgi:hypothetical protein